MRISQNVLWLHDLAGDCENAASKRCEELEKGFDRLSFCVEIGNGNQFQLAYGTSLEWNTFVLKYGIQVMLIMAMTTDR